MHKYRSTQARHLNLLWRMLHRVQDTTKEWPQSIGICLKMHNWFDTMPLQISHQDSLEKSQAKLHEPKSKAAKPPFTVFASNQCCINGTASTHVLPSSPGQDEFAYFITTPIMKCALTAWLCPLPNREVHPSEPSKCAPQNYPRTMYLIFFLLAQVHPSQNCLHSSSLHQAIKVCVLLATQSQNIWP